MSSYPKWLYHPAEAAVVVADEAEHKALGKGWVEAPVEPEADAHGKSDAHAEKHSKKGK